MSQALRAQRRQDPRRRAFWLKHLYRWHWVSSAACLIGMLLFTVTGITLNHAAHIESRGAHDAGIRGHARMTGAALFLGGTSLGVPGDRLAAAAAVAVAYGVFCALAAYRHRRRRRRKTDGLRGAAWSIDPKFAPPPANHA